MYKRITWETHVKSFFISLITAAAFYTQGAGAVNGYLSTNYILFPTTCMVVNFFIQMLFVLFVVSIVHELIHGAVYRFFGGRVRYGVRYVYAYTREVSGRPMGRGEMLVILMAPLVLISCAPIFLNSWPFIMACFINLLGSSGDIYIALELLKHSPDCRFIDRDKGYEVLNPDEV